MKTILGVFIFSISSLWLLVWILVLGFQNRSLADMFGGTFGQFDSAEDIFLTFVVPLALMLGFSIMAFSIIKNLKKLN